MALKRKRARQAVIADPMSVKLMPPSRVAAQQSQVQYNISSTDLLSPRILHGFELLDVGNVKRWLLSRHMTRLLLPVKTPLPLRRRTEDTGDRDAPAMCGILLDWTRRLLLLS